MEIHWDVEVPVRDRTRLRADVFLPKAEGRYPVVLSHGLYGKFVSFQEAYGGQWQRTVTDFPEILKSSSNKYQAWEVADPEPWTERGYAVVRVDSRGAGRSPGVQETWSRQEVLDYYDAIEWAGTAGWSDGNVGLLGISYYAANQWNVAALQPPHLKAIVPWEGTSDLYRELYYHGGIRCTFVDSWIEKQRHLQHGYSPARFLHKHTGQPVTGPEELSSEELAAQRVDPAPADHPLVDPQHAAMQVDWSRVTVPLLSSANWGGAGLHLRGNVEGFVSAASEHKWLEIHGLEHWSAFYGAAGLDLQMRFFDRYLKGEENGWEDTPRILMDVRTPDGFRPRTAESWPLPETDWQTLFLSSDGTLAPDLPAEAGTVTYEPMGGPAVFVVSPGTVETEIVGPVRATLFVSSESEDADLFLVLTLLDTDGHEVSFRGAMDAHAPLAQGWLRVSHRALDQDRSLPYRPYHPHDKVEPLEPGAVYEVEVEIWPTSIIIPAGYSLALQVWGKDYEFSGPIKESARSFHRYPSKGCGPFLHNDPQDRPEDIFSAPVTIHSGPDTPSHVLLPVIPTET